MVGMYAIALSLVSLIVLLLYLLYIKKETGSWIPDRYEYAIYIVIILVIITIVSSMALYNMQSVYGTSVKTGSRLIDDMYGLEIALLGITSFTSLILVIAFTILSIVIADMQERIEELEKKV